LAICPADGVRGDHPHLEGSVGRVDLGAASIDNSGIQHENPNIFILGLDTFHAHDTSMDLRCRVLRLGKKEVPIWQPGA
jgi:hypothetical protein